MHKYIPPHPHQVGDVYIDKDSRMWVIYAIDDRLSQIHLTQGSLSYCDSQDAVVSPRKLDNNYFWQGRLINNSPIYTTCSSFVYRQTSQEHERTGGKDIDMLVSEVVINKPGQKKKADLLQEIGRIVVQRYSQYQSTYINVDNVYNEDGLDTRRYFERWRRLP